METNNIITAIPLGSPLLNELFSSLAKAQAAMLPAFKTSDNPFFKSKYADFAEIVHASRPALTAHGLSVMQRIILLADGSEALHSVLGHSSGQYIDSVMRIRPAKNDVQALGSYITYLKRYAYAALIGVATEDDDGEAAMARTHEQGSNTANDSNNDNKIDREQLTSLLKLISSLPNATVLENNIKKFNSVTDFKDLKQSQFEKVIAYIERELKS